ncbi:MAG: SIMPL domain-containing protein [Acidimicrobiia bacterium]
MRSLKKSSLALVPLALGTGLALGSVGISGAAAPKAESSTKPAVVTVDGLGLVKGKPDTITVSLGVDVNGASVSAALTRSNDRAAALIKLLKDAGVKDDDIATTNFSIYPNYNNDGTQVTGYRVSNTVSATIRDLGKAGSTIDAAAREVGDEIRMNGVNFGIDDDTGMLAQARGGAVKNAREKADQLAKGAGLKVLRVKSIEETSAPEATPMAYEAARVSADAASSVPLSGGTQSRSVTVRVVYELG